MGGASINRPVLGATDPPGMGLVALSGESHAGCCMTCCRWPLAAVPSDHIQQHPQSNILTAASDVAAARGQSAGSKKALWPRGVPGPQPGLSGQQAPTPGNVDLAAFLAGARPAAHLRRPQAAGLVPSQHGTPAGRHLAGVSPKSPAQSQCRGAKGCR